MSKWSYKAKQEAIATCNKCGFESKGAAGCSHASCGGFFVIFKEKK